MSSPSVVQRMPCMGHHAGCVSMCATPAGRLSDPSPRPGRSAGPWGAATPCSNTDLSGCPGGFHDRASPVKAALRPAPSLCLAALRLAFRRAPWRSALCCRCWAPRPSPGSASVGQTDSKRRPFGRGPTGKVTVHSRRHSRLHGTSPARTC
jgi:hypothetical protein